jgi:hypothetical protein
MSVPSLNCMPGTVDRAGFPELKNSENTASISLKIEASRRNTDA